MSAKKIERVETVESKILLIHRQQVMIDRDLAELYDVPTRILNEQVKRNSDRFPGDFMFRLSKTEYETLRSQIAISKKRGGRRYLPYAFTEQGVAMLSTVLRSEKAIQVNITIMRAFVNAKGNFNNSQRTSPKVQRTRIKNRIAR